MEEDINFIRKYMQDYYNEDIAIEDDFKFEKAIENLLKRYKELQKENDDYKKYAVMMSTEGLLINGVKFSFNDFIPISVIQNEIDKLGNMLQETMEGKLQKYTPGEIIFLKRFLENLLEERNKKYGKSNRYRL